MQPSKVTKQILEFYENQNKANVEIILHCGS